MSVFTVSVIIPNYNRENFIGETISNLLAQTLPPHEIIVVDDGSTDKSVEVIRSFGDKVKLIQQSNQGPGAARNAGLRIATGEFIQFQDSDDLFSLNKLEAQAKLLEQTGADIAFSPWVKLKIEGHSVILEDHVLQQKMPQTDLSLPCWWLRGWSTVFQSLMFRRSFLSKVGFYRTDLILGEDGELFFKALTSSPHVAFTDEALTFYRLHNMNKITQNEGTSQARRAIDWARCLRCMIERCENSGLKMDFQTRSIFLSGIRKHLRYLRAAPDAPVELINFLSKFAAQLPGGWLGAVEWWLRLAEQGRLRAHGSRWMPAYRAAAITENQRALVRELGFEVGKTA
jgi:glycosyltransferase involved in cell wall biosynthesis